MREFKSAAKAAFDPTDTIEFKLDDEVLVCTRPTTDQVVMLMASEASEIRSDNSRIAALIDVSLSLFDTESRRTLSRHLMDPTDPFTFMPNEDDPDAASLIGLIQWVIEEWSNRPTKPLSDSTSSSENGGTSSTGTASVEASDPSTPPQLTSVT